MKRPVLTSVAASATLFLILPSAPSLRAQEMREDAPGSKAASKSDELLKRFDRNGDGKLDDDERAGAKELMLKEQVDRQMARAAELPGGLEQFRAEALQLFDRNRDGRLDEEERVAAQKFAAVQEAAAEGREQLKKRFDRNGDGTLDAGENARIDTFLSALRGLGGVQARREFLRRFDLNADGKIDEREFVELEQFVRPRVEASPEQVRRHDGNGDGKLDDAEWIVARRTISQWLNGSGPAAFGTEAMRSAESGATKLGGAPSREAEQARLNASAQEGARRRALREAKQKTDGTPN